MPLPPGRTGLDRTRIGQPHPVLCQHSRAIELEGDSGAVEGGVYGGDGKCILGCGGDRTELPAENRIVSRENHRKYKYYG